MMWLAYRITNSVQRQCVSRTNSRNYSKKRRAKLHPRMCPRRSGFLLQISRTEPPTPIRNRRQRAHCLAHRSCDGGCCCGIDRGLLHRLGWGDSGCGGRAARAMSRNCRTGCHAHTHTHASPGTASAASTTTASAGTANTVAAGGTFFVGPSLHALCECCILLLVGVYAILECFLFVICC